MLHVRILVPVDLTAAVLAALDKTVGVANVCVLRGVGHRPPGDVIELDAAREVADDLLDHLRAFDIERLGAITMEQIDLSLSEAAQRAAAAAPGNATDAVIWQEVEARTGDDSALTGTFLTFLTIATMLAAIGIATDSAVTVVGAMVVGPEFGALAAIAVGLVRRRRALARRGLVAIVVGFPLAMTITAIAT